MREQRMVKVDGITAQADIYRCDGKCRKLLDPMKNPIVVAQSSFIFQYPDGYNEVVHISNESAGRFRYYCLPCFENSPMCGSLKEEHDKCRAALKRRVADLLAVKEEQRRRQQPAQAAERAPKGKARPN